MALDGAFLYAVQQELQPLIGYRVEKIHQPAKEELILALRSREGSEKLLISASADRARIHKTAVSTNFATNTGSMCMTKLTSKVTVCITTSAKAAHWATTPNG